MPVVRSGFGDGSYQVTELLDGRERVGFEVLLIVESEPYPFGKESTTVSSDDNPASSTSDAVNNFLGEMLAKIQQVKEGNAADKKEAFKSAMAELVREQEEKFRAQAEEFREFLLKHRQSAPVVETRVHSHTDDLSGDPQIASRRALLESAGYRFLGSYVFDGIPGFVLLLFLHDQNGTVASISSGKDINTEFEADYPDGIGFHVRDTAPVPGLTQPPWATYRYEIGKSVPELMAAFETHRPPGHVMFTEPEAVADLTNDFERSQSWRLDRGGWTRAEVRTQMGIGDGTGREDELTEACLAVREKWLYAWFRKCHPAIAGQYRDGLVIVHDELDSTFTYMLWAIGGGSLKVRRREFEGRPATAAFREVNQANACPLKLVAQKSEGYRADFYLPAELVGDRDA